MKRRPLIITLGTVATLIATVAYATGRNRYETAGYTVLKTDGSLEIRSYRPLAVASTAMENENSGFRRLFSYITGRNQNESKIAMTTPVFVSSDGKKKEVMSFVLPSEVAEAGAPEPAGGNVFLDQLDGGKFAVYRYSGRSSAQRDAQALTKLGELIASSGMGAEPGAKPRYAYYDPPWTLGPLRRNEVMIKVR